MYPCSLPTAYHSGSLTATSNIARTHSQEFSVCVCYHAKQNLDLYWNPFNKKLHWFFGILHHTLSIHQELLPSFHYHNILCLIHCYFIQIINLTVFVYVSGPHKWWIIEGLYKCFKHFYTCIFFYLSNTQSTSVWKEAITWNLDLKFHIQEYLWNPTKSQRPMLSNLLGFSIKLWYKVTEPLH